MPFIHQTFGHNDLLKNGNREAFAAAKASRLN